MNILKILFPFLKISLIRVLKSKSFKIKSRRPLQVFGKTDRILGFLGILFVSIVPKLSNNIVFLFNFLRLLEKIGIWVSRRRDQVFIIIISTHFDHLLLFTIIATQNLDDALFVPLNPRNFYISIYQGKNVRAWRGSISSQWIELSCCRLIFRKLLIWKNFSVF
jgi:hypothetical protein